jgi:hypothetical protein
LVHASYNTIQPSNTPAPPDQHTTTIVDGKIVDDTTRHSTTNETKRIKALIRTETSRITAIISIPIIQYLA